MRRVENGGPTETCGVEHDGVCVVNDTVDGRNPARKPPGMVLKPVVNNGINYLLPDARFLNHQQ